MKKVLLLIWLVVASASVYSQTKINGIGNFRLGKTIQVIKSELRDSNVKYMYPKNMDQFELARLRIFPFNKCDKVTVLYIPLIYISNVKAEGIRLSFYNDTLYSVKLEDRGLNDLTEAIDFAYGEGELRKVTRKVNCTYTYTGAVIEKEEFNVTKTWRSDDSVRCSLVMSQFYTQKCEELTSLVFELIAVNHEKLVLECEDSTRVNRLKQKEEAKKEKYKNFK